MEQNVGTKERVLRVGLGMVAGLAALKYRRSKWIASTLASAAVTTIKSGLEGYCPMKRKLGFGEGAALSPAPVSRAPASSSARSL